MMDTRIAHQIIESLRSGKPPQRGTTHYAVGLDQLLDGIRRFHLNAIADQGLLRFVSGSWGTGKTHLFRLIRELAFENGCLVSGVELHVKEAPFNKFERVLYAIIRNIATPSALAVGSAPVTDPFGIVLHEALVYLATGTHAPPQEVTPEHYAMATKKLMACTAIDMDFRKIVKLYWETYLPDARDPVMVAEQRDELLQWFSGQGTIGEWRKRFGIHKVVGKDNAKLMLQSLAALVQLVGYRGLVILFDEAEMSYSLMRKSALKEAHNNLLHLINHVAELPGLLLLYATTPDFYTDPKHGIVIYGALARRIGKPRERAPKALDLVWNLDAVEFSLDQYREGVRKLRAIYCAAYPDAENELPDEQALDAFVMEIHAQHPALSQVGFWRVLMTATVQRLDQAVQGERVATARTYRSVMRTLREH